MKKSKVASPSVASSLQAFEAQFVRPAAGRALIVGSRIYGDREDRRARYPDAVGLDMLAGPGVDLVQDLEEGIPDGQFAHVDCLSVLEHSRRPWLLAANLERLLLPGGTIFVSVPFCWPVHSYPSDYFRMTPEGLKSLFSCIEWGAVGLAAQELTFGAKLPRVQVDGFPHFPRCETVGFGRRA